MSAKELMSVIDDIKDKLTDNEYLKLSSLLLKRNKKEGKKYNITYIKQKSLVRFDGDNVFTQEIKRKIAYINNDLILESCNNCLSNIVKIRFNDDVMDIIHHYNTLDYVNREDDDDEDDDDGKNKRLHYNDKILLSIKPIDDNQ